MLEDGPAHASADLRAQDGILRQSQVDAEGLFGADGRQSHNLYSSPKLVFIWGRREGG